MSHFVQYAGEADAGRGQSFALWNPYLSAIHDIRGGNFSRGVFFQDDFLYLQDDRYLATQNTSGTFALADEEGGVAIADSGGVAAANNGIQVQMNTSTTGEMFLPAANLDLVFECRVKARTITTGPRMFVGLAQHDTTLMNGTEITSQGIGFRSTTDDGLVLGIARDGVTTSATPAAGLHDFVDGAYVKLGLRVKGITKVEYYVNGVKQSNTVIANIPVTLLLPSLVAHTDGTTQSKIDIDWWQFLKVLQDS